MTWRLTALAPNCHIPITTDCNVTVDLLDVYYQAAAGSLMLHTSHAGLNAGDAAMVVDAII